jgi:hypothetical protein
MIDAATMLPRGQCRDLDSLPDRFAVVKVVNEVSCLTIIRPTDLSDVATGLGSIAVFGNFHGQMSACRRWALQNGRSGFGPSQPPRPLPPFPALETAPETGRSRSDRRMRR